MQVVSDTSPVLNLAIIGRLELLLEQFGKILIPSAVLAELRSGENLPGSQAIREALESGWIEIREAKDAVLIQVLQRELDKGEAEAVALALQLKANWTILDEREARRVAKCLGLDVTGTLGILARAKLTGRISSLYTTMVELREKAGFRIGEELFAKFVRSVGEDLESISSSEPQD